MQQNKWAKIMGIIVQERKLAASLDPGHPRFGIGFQCRLRAVTWKPISKTAHTRGSVLLSAFSLPNCRTEDEIRN